MYDLSAHSLVVEFLFFFFFKQKTAYEMRISDWSSDVCSSDLLIAIRDHAVIVVLDRLVLGPHEAALDIERTVDVDADENARHRHVLGREDRRPRHYGADLLVDRGDARIDLVGNVGLARPFVLEPEIGRAHV